MLREREHATAFDQQVNAQRLAASCRLCALLLPLLCALSEGAAELYKALGNHGVCAPHLVTALAQRGASAVGQTIAVLNLGTEVDLTDDPD